eukprot:9480753-Pyramimonas_sp.AAC.2
MRGSATIKRAGSDADQLGTCYLCERLGAGPGEWAGGQDEKKRRSSLVGCQEKGGEGEGGGGGWQKRCMS